MLRRRAQEAGADHLRRTASATRTRTAGLSAGGSEGDLMRPTVGRLRALSAPWLPDLLFEYLHQP